jgi:UrcA family protein
LAVRLLDPHQAALSEISQKPKNSLRISCSSKANVVSEAGGLEAMTLTPQPRSHQSTLFQETTMYSNSKINSTMFSAIAAAVMSLVCTFGVAGAFVPKQIVKFQDLNIGSPAGVADLSRRLHAAAQHVCFEDWDKDPIKAQRAEACASEAEARAVSHVNLPALTAYYQLNAGRQSSTLTASLAR